MSVNPIPDGYRTVTPCLIVSDGAKQIEFLQAAFDAQVVGRFDSPDGGVAHAELKIGDSMIMLGEARDGFNSMPCMIHLYVNDCDALYKRALAAGAESVREPADQFYGDRSGGVKDAFGNQWWIGTHVEDVPLEEIQRRMETHIQEQAKAA